MKTNWLPALLFPALLLTAGCSHEGDSFGPRVRGTGPTQTEKRAVANFNRVELKIDAEVILTQGPQREVHIEAQRNILDVLETELSGDELQIEYGHARVVGHDPIKVYITTPSLSEVEVSGSGKMRTATPWSAASFRVAVSGSGEADINVTAVDGLRTNVSGSGEVKLGGTAASNTINISGSGKVSAYDLSTQDTYASISGSGKAYVRAARTLSAEISGSGTVYYRGTPTVTTRISGSGKVLTGN
ncbi:head GIN domain-containing protein [Hymenobacter coalescens]